MKRSTIYALLLALATLWACDRGQRNQTEHDGMAMSGGSEVAQNDFNYLQQDAGRLLESWMDSAGLHQDLPQINEAIVAPDLFAFYSSRDFSPAWNKRSARELLTVIG